MTVMPALAGPKNRHCTDGGGGGLLAVQTQMLTAHHARSVSTITIRTGKGVARVPVARYSTVALGPSTRPDRAAYASLNPPGRC